MALKRVEVELSVERPAPGPTGQGGGTVRMTARFLVDPPDRTATIEELSEALKKMDRELSEAVERLPRGPGSRAERELSELIETYHPRQTDLIDLLLGEGELTERESLLLRDHLSGRLSFTASPNPVVPIEPRGRASVEVQSIATDRGPMPARPVTELIETYRIESLKQAGAVRARRKISFAEYMALKQHYATTESPPSPSTEGS